jgi:glycosyltransferase involved in cell wall biosynthesis
MSTPRVTVLVGSYNGAGKIGRALGSILAQTVSDLEVIVIDDGSTDGTVEVVRAVQSRDPRVRLEVLNRNVGIALSLNRGLSLARASAVAIQDQDDWSELCRLERQLELLRQRPDVAVVGSRMREVDAEGRELVARTAFAAGDVTEKLMYFNPIPNGSALFRRDLALELNGYDPRYRFANDYDLWLRVADRHRVFSIAEALSTREMWGGNFGASHEREQTAEAISIRLAAMRRRRSLRGAAGLVLPSLSWLTPAPLRRLRRRILGQAVG